jgi:hypothetical protein
MVWHCDYCGGGSAKLMPVEAGVEWTCPSRSADTAQPRTGDTGATTRRKASAQTRAANSTRNSGDTRLPSRTSQRL